MTNLKITEPNDILILFASFNDSKGEKKRPILVLKINSDSFYFFSLTTKYQNKSNKIKKQYYKIKKWKESGLLKPTYIDIGRIREISFQPELDFYKIGQLDSDDINGLAEFALNYSQYTKS